ncbi:MAG: hypothetical protein WDO16_16650 [Bacteroidota bacterium]
MPVFRMPKEVSGSLEQPVNNVTGIENEKLGRVVTRQTTKTFLNGYIIDESNTAVQGAIVSCNGNTVTTDNKGYFQFIQAITVNRDYVLISVTKTGYMNGFRTFTPNRNRLAYHTEKIMLQSEKFSSIITSSSGGTITIDNIKLSFPANAVVKSSGAEYAGNYKVKARYINRNPFLSRCRCRACWPGSTMQATYKPFKALVWPR